jgi:hypothetical protein
MGIYFTQPFTGALPPAPDSRARLALGQLVSVVSEGNMSSPAQQVTGTVPARERSRVSARLLPKSLIYVACGEANGGMVLNFSDDGLAVSMALGVGDEAYSNLNVRMNGLPQSVEVCGRMVWTTASKRRAGIQLIDVSGPQREQIREWMALEGVRDVNLAPRRVEPVAVPEQIETTAAAPVQGQAAQAVEIEREPEIAAQARSSLLDVFGGTAPQTLGPPLPEQIALDEEARASEPSRGFAAADTAAFRDQEWDLASVTMVPRKRAAIRPEGLSTFWLIVLWVAIPSFGIGILVGRRPLKQWLAGSAFVEKGWSAAAESGAGNEAREKAATELLSKQAAVEPTEIAESEPLETPAEAHNTDPQTAGGVLSSDLTASIVEPGLLNSMSTQEARAYRNSSVKAATSEPVVPSGSAGTVSSQLFNTGEAKNVTKPVAVPPVVPPVVQRNYQDQRTPSFRAENYGAPPARPSAQSSVSSSTAAPANQPSVSTANLSGAANLAAAKPSARASSVAVPDQRVSGSSSPVSTITNDSKPTGPVSNAAASNPLAPSLAASSSVVGNSFAANSGAGANAMSFAPTAVRSIVSGGTPALAPVSVQPALHGTMLIARKNDQSFLFKFPMEAVPGDSSVSMRMQRVVQVPPASRWHGHGPIAKVQVGELLAQAPLDKPEATAKPRAGDTVTVRAFVDKNGGVEDLKPVSGRFLLTPRVMRAVRNWQFDQTLIDGKAVESEVDITVEFH